MYEIEYNIEYPKFGKRYFGTAKMTPITSNPSKKVYPFSEMQVGDSFWVADGKSAKICARYHAKRHNMLFRSKTELRDDIRGVRIWRIK